MKNKTERQKIVYYTDELNDEFSTAKIKAKKIDAGYKYIRDGFFSRVFSFVLYRLLFMPFSFLALKIAYGIKIKGREKIKKEKRGYFLYGNHTNAGADPFIPTFVSFCKKVFVIVHPANVSMPILGRLNPYLGALPLPDDMAATQNFVSAVKLRISQNRAVCIYPEAHIWPYCTEIRNFSDASFRYPVKYGAPSYCFTTVYTKRKHTKRPKMTIYVDGPFFADKNLSPAAAKQKLRNEVFSAMKKRSELSDYDGVIYVKAEEKPND